MMFLSTLFLVTTVVSAQTTPTPTPTPEAEKVVAALVRLLCFFFFLDVFFIF